MKHCIPKSLCSLAVLAVTSLPVLAADSVEVKVIGTIKPVACVPALGGGGVLDYGTIPFKDLAVDKFTVLPPKGTSFSITCDGLTTVAVKATNNRVGSLAGTTEGAGNAGDLFDEITLWGTQTYAIVGLGTASNGAKIGGYGIRIATDGVKADGVDVDTLYSKSLGKTWTKTTFGGLYNKNLPIYASWAKTGELTPLAFKTLSGQLEVTPYINKSSELDPKAPIVLDGSTTLELVYL